MKQIAKLFSNGRSQAVRLPVKYRFEGREVLIEKDPVTGNIILSGKPDSSWEDFLEMRNRTDVPDEFLLKRGDGPPQKRELF